MNILLGIIRWIRMSIAYIEYNYRCTFKPRMKAINLLMFFDRINRICTNNKVEVSVDNAEKLWKDKYYKQNKYIVSTRDMLHKEDLYLLDTWCRETKPFLKPELEDTREKRIRHIRKLENRIKELESNVEKVKTSTIEELLKIDTPGAYIITKRYADYKGKIGEYMILKFDEQEKK